jgi:hypothetical protein
MKGSEVPVVGEDISMMVFDSLKLAGDIPRFV